MRLTIVAVLGVLAACAAARDPIASAPIGPGPSPSDEASTPSEPPAVALPDAEARICKLEKPIVSDDACATDADCAPATPCHATRCVGKANAEPRKPGTMCTQEIRCGTIDVNACGCLNGKCALFARP